MRFPSEIRPFVEGSQFERVHIGDSGTSVFRIRIRGTSLFLKCAPVAEGAGLGSEAERLRWLAGRLPIPDVLSFSIDDDWEYLLVTSLPGVNGVEAGREHPEVVATGLAQALKLLHAQPVAGCPFDQTVAVQIERARQRAGSGLVDEANFDEERLGRTAPELLVELDAYRPDDEARVLTHGDPCLPNVMFDEARVAGFLDCGRVGVADPYQDLALADNLDVAANMFLGRERTRAGFVLDESSMERASQETLESLSVTTMRSVRQIVSGLSGGQRQAVAVAKSVMWNSKLVILDEPTAALGVAQTRQVLDLVRRLAERNLGVAIISHNLHDVFEVADRITVLRLGQRVAMFERAETTQQEVVQALTAGTLDKVPGMADAGALER